MLPDKDALRGVSASNQERLHTFITNTTENNYLKLPSIQFTSMIFINCDFGFAKKNAKYSEMTILLFFSMLCD